MTQIVNKLKEAKGVKTYSILHTLSKNVSQSYLLRLITPFKDVRLLKILLLKCAYDKLTQFIIDLMVN